MKTNARIAGVGMTRFGKHAERSLKSLAGEAITAAVADAGLAPGEIEAAYMANAAAAVITGQVCVPGEIVLRELGIGKIPVVNVENACASAGTALNQAAAMVSHGAYDVVLACGYEKLYHENKARTLSVFSGSVDVERLAELGQRIEHELRGAGIDADVEGAGQSRSLFMDLYAVMAVDHMRRYGTTREQLAAVSAKNSLHGSLNPRAQYTDVLTVADVLAAREVAYPLTLPMCAPIGDGAAAVVLVGERKARELGLRRPPRIVSSVLRTGWDYSADGEQSVFELAIAQAYDEAALGPGDVSCVELHDASAPAEIIHTEYLGLCEKGEGGRFVEEGHSTLGGRVPVNTSGGLLRKEHPIGATGIAQIVELADQLGDRAGARQVEGARVGIAENGGGYIGGDVAALVVTILQR